MSVFNPRVGEVYISCEGLGPHKARVERIDGDDVTLDMWDAANTADPRTEKVHLTLERLSCSGWKRTEDGSRHSRLTPWELYEYAFPDAKCTYDELDRGYRQNLATLAEAVNMMIRHGRL